MAKSQSHFENVVKPKLKGNQMSAIQFNHLTAEHWAEVLSLYDELVVLSAQQQQDKLNNPELKYQTRSLLQQMLNTKDTYDWLEQPIDPLADALMGPGSQHDLQNPEHMEGREFGVWKVTKELSQGGMGQVFLAERADGQYSKTAALKTIKAGYFSSTTQQKFITEMQTLAQLEHPNIARLIDGGVSDEGVLYFVMEWVEGKSILDYARSHQLSLNQRLELMIQLCQAVAYAHQNLIIHGDLKPDNVLVNQQGQIKLLDFGVAGPIQPWVEGHQQVVLPQFTLLYAAPEQLSGKKLSTASDVFGLTAILYELLCGLAPRDEVVNDKIPSSATRYSVVPITDRINIGGGQQAAFWVGMSHKRIAKALHTELGAVIIKGLAEQVEDRYKTADELERDIQAVLQDEPVLTYCATKPYWLKKRLAQYKLPITIAMIGVIGMMVFAFMSLTQYRQAKAAAQKANWTSEFLINVFDQADPVKNQQNPITVNELTAAATAQLLEDDSDFIPAVRLNALSLMGKIQFKLGQAESASKIHLKQIDLLQQSGDLDLLAQAHFDLAMDYQQLGLFELALEHFKRATEVIPLTQKVTHMGVTAKQSMALIYLRFNKLKEAEMIINTFLSMQDEILQADKPFESMSNVYVALAWIAEANENYELGLEAIEKTKYYFKKLPYDPIFYAELLATESSIYSQLRQYEKAVKLSQQGVELFKQHYGLNHPETMTMLSQYASLLGLSGDFEGSIKAYIVVIEIMENNQVPDFYAPIMYQNLAHKYRETEQCNQALEYFKKAESLWDALESRRVEGELSTLSGMARCYLLLDEWLLSESYFDQALQVANEVYGVEHPQYALYQLMMVPLLLEQNKIAELNQIIPKIHQALIDAYGPQSQRVARATLNWAQLYEKQADIENTRLMAQQALDIYLLNEPANNDQKFITEAQRLIGLGQ